MLPLASLLRRHKILLLSLLVAATLMFFRLADADLVADDTIYASRAIGLADVIFSEKQSTPYRWFETIPWWARLSFHDHPTPLLFIIEHLFLRLAETAVMAKLPYTLMTLGSIALTYFLVRFLCPDKKRYADWTAILMTLANGLIWLGRHPHLEGGVLFFALLALVFFLRFIANPRRWLSFGLTLGLMLLTKYNALFVLPTLALYLVLFHRPLLRDKRLWLSLALALLIFTPVIIYNVMLFKTRGHLDLQLTRLLRLPSPWDLSGAEPSLRHLATVAADLMRMNSLPYLSLALAGLILIWRHEARRRVALLGFYLLFLFFFLFLTGPDKRLLVLSTPVLALAVAVTLTTLEQKLTAKYKSGLRLGQILLGLYLLTFIWLNQHTLAPPRTNHILFTSHHRSENYGLSQLDRLLDNYVTTLLTKENAKTFNAGEGIKAKNPALARFQRSPNQVSQFNDLTHIFVYDDTINWFARQWLFERRTLYHNLPFYSPEILYKLQTLFATDTTPKTYFLIQATNDTLREPDATDATIARDVEQRLLAAGDVEPTVVRRRDGRVAFKIYEFQGSFGVADK